jgi:hypothetical protein
MPTRESASQRTVIGPFVRQWSNCTPEDEVGRVLRRDIVRQLKQDIVSLHWRPGEVSQLDSGPGLEQRLAHFRCHLEGKPNGRKRSHDGVVSVCGSSRKEVAARERTDLAIGFDPLIGKPIEVGEEWFGDC